MSLEVYRSRHKTRAVPFCVPLACPMGVNRVRRPLRSKNANKRSSATHLDKGRESRRQKNATSHDGTKAQAREVEPLSEQGLKKLQREISKLEIDGTNRCSHYLCSDKNMRSIRKSRLWFLFELEMTYDGYQNLRDSCYLSHVYKRLEPSWGAWQNTLKVHNDESFNVDQLIIPNVPLLAASTGIATDSKDTQNKVVDPTDKHTRYLGKSLLERRGRMVVFEECHIDPHDILSNKSSSFDENQIMSTLPETKLATRKRYF